MRPLSAMIFAAGYGTRLKPWTDSHPKALVEVDGVPMLGRVIQKLRHAGAERIIINTHHFAEQIEKYLIDNDDFGCKILISRENELLDTGGGVANALIKFGIEGPLLLHNADILTDFDLVRMINAYADSGNSTQLLMDTRTTSRYLLIDDNSTMQGWVNPGTSEVRGPAKNNSIETSSLRKLAFGGVHLLNEQTQRHLIQYSTNCAVFSIIDFYIEACNVEPIMAYVPKDEYLWHDVGTNEKLYTAREHWQNKYHGQNV